MEIIDANIVLRYYFDDIPELSDKAAAILEFREVMIPFEVISEVVYVLAKGYQVSRAEIRSFILMLLKYSNIHTSDAIILQTALQLYHEQNFDFIDSILLAYNHQYKYIIHTFDKKMIREMANHQSP